MCGTSIILVIEYRIHLHNSHSFVVGCFLMGSCKLFSSHSCDSILQGQCTVYLGQLVILDKYSLCLLLRDYESVKNRPLHLYSPGFNVIKLDYFTSEFNRIQSHIDLTGMSVVLDPLPKQLRFVQYTVYHSLSEQLKSRQNYQPLAYLHSGHYYSQVCVYWLFGINMTQM